MRGGMVRRRQIVRAAVVGALFGGGAAGCACPRVGTDSAGGGSDSATDAGPLLPLSLASVVPPGAWITGGATVDITGSGFVDGLVVSFDGAPCLNLQVEFSGVASCVVPPAPNGAGVVDVVATRPADGATATLPGGFTYTNPPGAPVAWCNLQYPPAVAVGPGATTEEIFGRLFVSGTTNGAGPGTGVTAQVGWGPDGTTPDPSGATWTWAAAAYTGDVDGIAAGDLANDEYAATLAAPATTGAYDYAFAFSTDGGGTWTFCDLDGNDTGDGGTNGYDPAQAGELTVSGPSTLPGWCNLQYPTLMTAVTDWPSGHAYGRVFATGVTTLPGAGAGVMGELGYGPDGTAPGAGWTFVPAAYNVDTDGGVNDEYWAALTVTSPGTYDFAWRFSIDGGSTWLPCDLDGNDGAPGGYDPLQAGTLVVEAPAGGTADWCNLQYPAALTVAPGEASMPVYGWVYRAGLTDSVGRGAGVIAEMGFGPDGSDPSASPAGWSFEAGSYNVDTGPMGSPTANDEYQGVVLVPAGTAPGTYDYAVRVSLDGGATFRYCDLDGNDGTTSLYDPAQAGELTVAP